MVERGEKNTYSDGLPKAIRIIDNKKVFYKKKKKKKNKKKKKKKKKKYR